ncbi:MAG: type II secretion system F family protein [Candidatus Aenigmatarchaeota archaeon]
MKRIPFVPFPLEKALKISKPFLFISSKLAKLNPFLAQRLAQAEIEVKDREYLAVAIFSSLFWFFIIFSLFSLLGFALKQNFLFVSLPFSFLISSITFFFITFYPNLLLSRKDRDIEKNLLFAIRHLFIQVRSGVSIFDSLVSVSKGNYGVISEELGKCVKEISTGKEETLVLEELAFRVPNVGFKRVIWQIVNCLKAGGDIGNTLDMIARNLSEEQKVKIRKYGSQLSPLALIYLMSTVILPTLGITFLIVFSSFAGIQVPETVFYLVLFVVVIFQIMLIGLVKSRRPSVEV